MSCNRRACADAKQDKPLFDFRQRQLGPRPCQHFIVLVLFYFFHNQHVFAYMHYGSVLKPYAVSFFNDITLAVGGLKKGVIAVRRDYHRGNLERHQVATFKRRPLPCRFLYLLRQITRERIAPFFFNKFRLRRLNRGFLLLNGNLRRRLELLRLRLFLAAATNEHKRQQNNHSCDFTHHSYFFFLAASAAAAAVSSGDTNLNVSVTNWAFTTGFDEIALLARLVAIFCMFTILGNSLMLSIRLGISFSLGSCERAFLSCSSNSSFSFWNLGISAAMRLFSSTFTVNSARLTVRLAISVVCGFKSS